MHPHALAHHGEAESFELPGKQPPLGAIGTGDIIGYHAPNMIPVIRLRDLDALDLSALQTVDTFDRELDMKFIVLVSRLDQRLALQLGRDTLTKCCIKICRANAIDRRRQGMSEYFDAAQAVVADDAERYIDSQFRCHAYIFAHVANFVKSENVRVEQRRFSWK